MSFASLINVLIILLKQRCQMPAASSAFLVSLGCTSDVATLKFVKICFVFCCNIFLIRGLNFLGWGLVLGLKCIWEQEILKKSLKSVLRSLDCSDHKLTGDELPILAHLLNWFGLG